MTPIPHPLPIPIPGAPSLRARQVTITDSDGTSHEITYTMPDVALGTIQAALVLAITDGAPSSALVSWSSGPVPHITLTY